MMTLFWLFLCCGSFQDTPVEEQYKPQTYLTPDVPLGTFNARDISVADLLSSISKEKKVNMVVDQGISVRLTLQLHATSLNTLLDLLANIHHLRVTVVNGIVYVSPPEAPPVPVPVNTIDFDVEAGTVAFNLSGLDVRDFSRQATRITGKNILLKEPNMTGSLKGFQAPLALAKGLELLLIGNGFGLKTENEIFLITRLPTNNPSTASDQAGPNTAGRKRAGCHYADGLFSMSYGDTELAKIISDIAATGSVSMVVHGQIKGKISIDVHDQGLEPLLRLLLSDTDYSFLVENGVTIIGSREMTTLHESRLVALKHLNAEMVEQILPQSIKERATLSIVKELNSLLIAGERSNTRALEKLILSLDKPIPQVLIEVLVVDFSLTDDVDVGLDLTNGNNKLFPGLDLNLEGYRAGSGTFKIRKLPSNFGLRLRALEVQDKARIVSKPHVATLNGHEAEIKIGTKQFYRIESEKVVGTDNPVSQVTEEIREIEANIHLKITPWISANGEVTTLIEPQFTTFLGTITDNIPPPISTRELKSTVRLKDGETIILGGLIEKFDTIHHEGIPFLSKIPLLRNLFRNRKQNNKKAELVIYITPHIYYGNEGSIEFINEQEGLDYQLDVKQQKDGIKGQYPKKKGWYKRLREGRKNDLAKDPDVENAKKRTRKKNEK